MHTKDRRPEGILIGLFFGVLFLATVDNQLLIPLYPRVSSEFSVPLAQVGWLAGAYALSAGLFNVLIGPLTDRLGRVPFLVSGLVAMAILALATTQVSRFGELVALRCLTGFAAGILSTCVAGLVGDLFPYHRRGKVMGLVLSAYFLALIIGVPVAVWLAEWAGWRQVFLATFGLAVGLLLPVALVVRAPRPARAPVPVLKLYRGFLRNRSTASALMTSFSISGATLAVLTYISALGLSPRQISTLFLIAGVAALAGSPLSGWLSDRYGKRRLFLVSNTLLSVPLVVVAELGWGALLICFFFVVSLLVAARQTALQTFQTELIGEESRGAFLGLRNGFSQLGISVAVLLAGLLLEPLGFRGVAWLAASLTGIGSLLFFWGVGEPPSRASRQSGKSVP